MKTVVPHVHVIDVGAGEVAGLAAIGMKVSAFGLSMLAASSEPGWSGGLVQFLSTWVAMHLWAWTGSQPSSASALGLAQQPGGREGASRRSSRSALSPAVWVWSVLVPTSTHSWSHLVSLMWVLTMAVTMSLGERAIPLRTAYARRRVAARETAGRARRRSTAPST